MNTDTESHLGLSCPYKSILCQEGYCNNCIIYEELVLSAQGAEPVDNPEWVKLKQEVQEILAIN